MPCLPLFIQWGAMGRAIGSFTLLWNVEYTHTLCGTSRRAYGKNPGFPTGAGGGGA
jgi:hypothetical protein